MLGRPLEASRRIPMQWLSTLIDVQWQQLMIPDTALLEMFVRGTFIYLGIFVILRVFRRPTGQLSVADVLLITIIADASQNAMAGGYESVTSGFMLIATIVFWDQLIDRLSFRYGWFAQLAEPRPVTLIREGKIERGSLEDQKITEDELLGHLRQHGIERPGEARLC